jgi:hypothetical protein
VIGFPPGPYRLATRFVVYRLLGVVLGIVAALGCIGGYGYMTWSSIAGIVHDDRVWSAGGREYRAKVDGRVTTRQFVLKSYELHVSYRLPGGEQKRDLSFDTLFGGIDSNADMAVRVLPGNPEEFALNAAVEASGKRWAAAAFLGVVGIFLLGGCCFFLAYSVAKQWRRASRAISGGVPVVCALVSRAHVMHQGRPTGTETFKFKVPANAAGGVETEVTYQFKTKGSGPLTLCNGTSVLAIVPPNAPTQAILLLRNCYPLALADVERTQAEAAIAGMA